MVMVSSESTPGGSEIKSMLTWVDMIKLSVPLLFSLLLIWLKEWYTSRRERNAKEEYLWRTITQEGNELGTAIREIDEITKAATERKLRAVAFDVSATRRGYAERLAELDPGHAGVYAAYSSQAEVVNKGIEAIKNLSREVITAEEINRSVLTIAIKAQAMTLKEDLLDLACNEMAILNTIKEIHQRTQRFGQGQIDSFKAVIEETKLEVFGTPGSIPQVAQPHASFVSYVIVHKVRKR